MYTKGEWKVKEISGTDTIIDSGNKVAHIAKVNVDNYDNVGNANLIVSAVNACISINPDNPQAVAESIKEMYEALKELIATYVLNRDSDGKFPHPHEFIACITPKGRPDYWDKAIKALSKAEGNNE